jgi:hypothetical protein
VFNRLGSVPEQRHDAMPGKSSEPLAPMRTLGVQDVLCSSSIVTGMGRLGPIEAAQQFLKRTDKIRWHEIFLDAGSRAAFQNECRVLIPGAP